MNPDVFLLIGLVDRPEFRPLAERLISLGEKYGFESRAYPSLEEAERKGGERARLILLLESRPGEYPRKGVARFRRLAPLAPILLLAGSLCLGEGRTGRLPAGAARFYLYEFETEVLPELEKFFRHETSRLALPATAGEEDFWREASFESPSAETVPLSRTEPGRTAVVAADPAMRRLLADSEPHDAPAAELASPGELLRLAESPRRILVDLTLPAEKFLPRFKEMTDRFSESEFVIYMFAPTPEETALFAAAGKRVTVRPKPFFRLVRPAAGTY